MGGTNSSNGILPKYVERATQDEVYAPPSYATMSDFSHVVNSNQRIGTYGVQSAEAERSGRNFKNGVHDASRN